MPGTCSCLNLNDVPEGEPSVDPTCTVHGAEAIARQGAALLAVAWDAAVAYRKHFEQHGIARAHVEDVEAFGVIHELADDGDLLVSQEEAVVAYLTSGLTPDWLPRDYDAPQHIYEAIVDVINAIGILKEGTSTS